MVWTRGMGPGIQEATPLVYHGVMYLPNPSDLIQAINAATGDLIWEYKRQWSEDVSKILPIAPSINRNIAIYGNNIIDTRAPTIRCTRWMPGPAKIGRATCR